MPKILKKIKFTLVLLLIVVMQFVLMPIPEVFAATTTVNLGTGANFAVFSAAAITDTAPSVVVGNVGATPIDGASIGIPKTEVTGDIYAVDGTGPSGSIDDPGLLTTARNDLKAAYIDAAGRTASPDIPTNLGGTTLTSGVYHAESGTFSITGGQTLTLNGEGNADAVFIFKMGTTLVTGTSSVVKLTNGAQACNVFWQVGSSATLGTSTTFVGNILANQSITDETGSTVDGRLLAGLDALTDTGAVTLNATHVTASTCASTSSTTSTTSSTGGTSGVFSPVCPPLASTIVAPFVIESRRVSPASISLSWGPMSGTDLLTLNMVLNTENGYTMLM